MAYKTASQTGGFQTVLREGFSKATPGLQDEQAGRALRFFFIPTSSIRATPWFLHIEL